MISWREISLNILNALNDLREIVSQLFVNDGTLLLCNAEIGTYT
jgi:hypothetical protein